MATKEDEAWNSGNKNDDWVQDSDSETDGKKGRCRLRCKNILKGLFSHVGITGMVMAYSVIGGLVFEHLEKTNEKQSCIQLMDKYTPVENKTMLNLWEVSRAYVNEFFTAEGREAMILKNDAIGEFEQILREFRTHVLELDYDGKNCTIMGDAGGPGHKWSFAGSLLFSVTVITTIGKFKTLFPLPKRPIGVQCNLCVLL